MAYTTVQAVRDALTPSGSQTPGTDTAASLTDAEIGEAIADAQAQIDAALSSAPTFYPVPLPDVPATPALIQSITKDIAVYLSTLTWRKGSQLPAQHAVVLRYQRAVAVLNDLASGKLDLPGYGADPDYTGAVVNTVPDQWTWYPDIGFGQSPQIPG